MTKKTPEERFWSRVEKIPFHECWEWSGGHLSNGYGRFHLKNGRYKYAHRLSWELHNGPIPSGLFVCHKCDNRGCVRPEHLFLGTAKDNTQDMITKERAGWLKNKPEPPPLEKPRRVNNIFREEVLIWHKHNTSVKKIASFYKVNLQVIKHIVKITNNRK